MIGRCIERSNSVDDLNNKDVANVEVIEEWIDDIDEMIKSQIEKEKEKKR